WGLDELIKAAEQMGILGDSHLDHSRALTRYRNYVHLGKQLREQRKVSQDEATFAITATRMAMDMLRRTVAPRGRRLAPGLSSMGAAVGARGLDGRSGDKLSNRDERAGNRRARIQRI